MKTAAWSELEKMPAGSFLLLDVREPEEYRRGTLPGAVNLPEKLLEEQWEAADKAPGRVTFARAYEEPVILRRDQPVYLLCHNGGTVSARAAAWLMERGFDAGIVQGGYRRYLASRLREEAEDPGLAERTAEVERSIIKKYRRSLWRPVTKALHDYQLIQAGDRIAVCIKQQLTLTVLKVFLDQPLDFLFTAVPRKWAAGTFIVCHAAHLAFS